MSICDINNIWFVYKSDNFFKEKKQSDSNNQTYTIKLKQSDLNNQT